MAFKYQIALIGNFADDQAKIRERLFVCTDQLGIDRSQLAVLEESEIGTANRLPSFLVTKVPMMPAIHP